MRSEQGYEGDELRALLREARGRRRQAEIAAAAKVSVGVYKRLESGRMQTSRLATLARIADALGVSAEDRTKLITLARPDLGRMLERESAASGFLLSAVRRLAIRLGRVRGRSAALRAAVELLHVSLAQGGMSFVFETRGTRGMRTGYFVGADLRSRAFPPSFQDVAANVEPTAMRRAGKGVETLCACIRENEDVFVVLGFVSRSDREIDRTYAEFLESIAAVLEIRLNAFARNRATHEQRELTRGKRIANDHTLEAQASTLPFDVDLQ